jgi:hypothetical protein
LAGAFLSPEDALRTHLTELERTLPRGATAQR